MKAEDFRACSLLRVLGSPPRYEIVQLLGDGDKTVGQLASSLNRPIQNISQHLRVLRNHNVVQYHTKGSRVFYRLKKPRVLELLLQARDMERRR